MAASFLYAQIGMVMMSVAWPRFAPLTSFLAFDLGLRRVGCLYLYRQVQLTQPVPTLPPHYPVRPHQAPCGRAHRVGEWSATSRVPSENRLAAEVRGLSNDFAPRAARAVQEGWLVLPPGRIRAFRAGPNGNKEQGMNERLLRTRRTRLWVVQPMPNRSTGEM